MDIFDIILDPPNSSLNIVVDTQFISFAIFGLALLITIFSIAYYRKYIAICTFNYITTLFKYEKISYKHFAFLLARILCYRHKTNAISKEDPLFKSSKNKQYLWFNLVDILNDVRYGKEMASNQSYTKLYKSAAEWLRHS